MDANVVVGAMSSFEVLEKVNSFYNHAWGMLIVAVTILITVFGFITPFLIQLFQKRFFKLEEAKIKEELKKEICLDVEDRCKKIEENLKKQVLVLDASIFHVQSLVFSFQGNFYEALKSSLRAVEKYIKGDNEVNLRIILGNIELDLNRLKKQDMENLTEEEINIDDSIKLLKEYDKNGRLGDLIINIRRSFSAAKIRST